MICFSEIAMGQWVNAGLLGKNIQTLTVWNGYLFAGEYNTSYQGSGGAVWRSSDGGRTWIDVGADSIKFAVISLAVENGFILVSTKGGGVYRSSDDGNNWIPANLGLPQPDGYFGSYVYNIALDDTVLFAGTYTPSGNGLIYRSSNDGLSWSASTFPYDSPVVVFAFAFSGDTVFAGTANGVFKSTDNGSGFLRVPTPAGFYGQVAEDNGCLFAEFQVGGVYINGLYRSSDGGNSWQYLTNDLPYNPQVVSLFLLDNNLLMETYSDSTGARGLYRTANDGNSWTNIRTGLPDDVGVTSHAVLNDTLYVGTGGDGVWATPVSYVTSVRNPPPRPESFSLSQNFPNPFNPTTVIRFNLPKMEEVSLKVYDILGRQVALLLDERLAAGDHTITFDGRLLPSGVYLYVLRSQNRPETRRMVLLK